MIVLFAINMLTCTLYSHINDDLRLIMILTLNSSYTIHTAAAKFVDSFLSRPNRQLQHLSTTVVYHSFIHIASGKFSVMISVIHII